MFWKKKKKFIVDDFSFLKDYGFSSKDYTCNAETDYAFTRNDLTISVYYYLGILETYKKQMCLDVVITFGDILGDNRRNLLKATDIFGEELINKLIADIKDLDADAQVPIYAKFLKDNIDTLLNYKVK
ncbi:MAG: hypothetical protein K2J01_06920 [Clostridiales bacterium]|nr:hypothetical protein [Clostridiales bacterium]